MGIPALRKAGRVVAFTPTQVDQAKTPKWRGKSPNAEKPYSWASEIALRRAVEVAAHQGLAVYIALCRLEARTPSDKKGSFYASLNEIGSLSGLSARRVTRHLDALSAARLIARIKPQGKAKVRHDAIRYSILSRKDKASASDKTERHLPNGQKPMHKTSDNKEYHGTTSHEESIALIDSAPMPSGGADQGAKQKEGIHTWE